MKISKLFPYLVFVLAFSLLACESTTDSGDSDGGDQPWERQFQYGFFKINGTNVLASEESTQKDHIMDTVCYSYLPSGALQTFSINIFVPTHNNPDYSSGVVSPEMTVFHGGSRTANISKDLIFVERVTINGVQFSKFLVGGQHTGTNITSNDFQQFRYDFQMVYLDDNSDEVRSDAKAVTINIKDC